MIWLWLLITLDALILLAAYSLVISLKLYHTIYNSVYRKRYQPDFAPTIAIFIPCKGGSDHFADNIRAFLTYRYQKMKVFFIVESQEDPAYLVIQHLVQHAPQAQVVVAGLASSCGQKNHNLLQGIRAAGNQAEVYVLLDSYTTITEQQLQELVLPLSDPTATVATGFRWNILQQQTLGERLHAFMIALQWSIMNCAFIPSVWGGAIAIRRQDFEKLGIREYWAKTVVDDMTLQHILQKNRKKAVFVPACVKETNNTIQSVQEAIFWFKRQVLYVKFYLRPYWFLTLILFCGCSANIIGFPVFLLYLLIDPGDEAVLLTATTGIFNVLAMLYCLGLKRPGNDNHSKLSWFLLSPVYLVLTGYACLLGICTNMLSWKGIDYDLDSQGYVKRIIRNEE
jgi:ceramide glucosyltransferase